MSEIPRDTEILLRTLSIERLAEIWCELNCWRWPRELADIKPPDFGSKHEGPINKSLGWRIMERCSLIIADKTISRTWNSDMSIEEFEYWYPRQ
jgi:hypothetical protein